jgi:Pyridoxamine 5'-phosphate oxidase
VTSDPPADRPYMPGYGIVEADGDLLDWSWAIERLTSARHFYVATVDETGRPHVMPVWGVWRDGGLWFSSGLHSRRARNLAARAACTAATDDPHRPVVVTGEARPTPDEEHIASFAHAVNDKYGTDYPVDFYDPSVNGCYLLTPEKVIGLDDADFAASPTRWRFDRGPV